MKWIKKGLICNVNDLSDWAYGHVHKSTPILIDEVTLRIYFGVRDRKNRTRTTFIEVNPQNPAEIKYIHDKSCLDLGKLGTFDDSGINVSSVVKYNGLFYMYYIGWNPGVTVPTRNAIDLAISKDGVTFERLYDGEHGLFPELAGKP